MDLGLDDLPGSELHDVLHAFRAQGPVQPTRFQGNPAFVISSYDVLLEAFLDNERFPPHLMYKHSLEPAIGESFISMPERERHLLYRKLATPAFRSRAVASYEREGLAALAHEVVDGLAGRSEVDLMADFAARFPYLVITRLLGLPREREEEFHAWALALLRYREEPQLALQASKEFTAYLTPIIEARRSEPRNDVISELILAEADGRRLTDAEIRAHVALLFPTGGESNHATLGNLLYALLSHEGSWQLLREHPARVGDAVDELFRWETSIALVPRLSASQPVEFHGMEIPADTWVLFAITGANRDPAVFTDPDRFDLDRKRKDGLTFGRGVKSCPGMHLARRNMQVGLEVLLERLPEIELLDLEAALPRRAVLRCPDAVRVSVGRR
ncbi:MAG: cytochrome P450 [Deltaproteobacteria bacterium]|nr:cytochrome P450 [Deltaproteobacteria bacterium]MBW2360735.1 cytochrome P450 [Deltaproteobacteria bacterium]